MTKLRIFFLLIPALFFSRLSEGQDLHPEPEPEPIQLHGALSITNNGFSFIPTFTLGAPAAIWISPYPTKGSVLIRSCDSPWKVNPGRSFSCGAIS